MSRKERRRSVRTVSNVPIDLYDRKGQMIIGEGRFINISLSGSMLESRQELPLHKSIRLQLQSPAKAPMDFTGRIVWRKKNSFQFTYGVRFDPISHMPMINRPSDALVSSSHR